MRHEATAHRAMMDGYVPCQLSNEGREGAGSRSPSQPLETDLAMDWLMEDCDTLLQESSITSSGEKGKKRGKSRMKKGVVGCAASDGSNGGRPSERISVSLVVRHRQFVFSKRLRHAQWLRPCARLDPARFQSAGLCGVVDSLPFHRPAWVFRLLRGSLVSCVHRYLAALL